MEKKINVIYNFCKKHQKKIEIKNKWLKETLTCYKYKNIK